MPALTLFGRQWRVGTDDFVVPGLIDLTITFVWLLASVIIYWKCDANLEFAQCADGIYLKLYLYGVFTILQVTIIVSAALVYNSKAGGIMETEKRRYVPLFLYIRLFLQLVQIAWNVLGSVMFALNGSLYCSTASSAVKLVIGFIICNWILIVFALYGISVVFDPLGGSKDNNNTSSHYRESEDSFSLSNIPDTRGTKLWTKRLRSWLFVQSSSNSMKNALHESGKLYSAIFANTSLVPTDVTAGWILLTLGSKDANKDETRLQNSIPVSEKVPVKTTEPESIKILSLDQLVNQDWRSPRLLSHYLKYAMASYTWPLVLFGKKPNALRRLFRHSFLCRCLPGRSHPLSVEGDNCCFCHTSGVRELTGEDDEDLVHLSFINKVFRTPFFIAKDNLTKSIIVAIRGTMSLTDIITDSTAWPTPIDYPGVPTSFKAHHGMVMCAKGIKEDLLKIVSKHLAENPTYKLVLTGTSLGAGTATILAIMLRNQFPDMVCYAFSPPGGLLSLDAAVFCNDFVTSVIYGNDIVTRLSIKSIENLKYALIDTIKHSKTPKYQIILGGLRYLFGGKRPTTIAEEELNKEESTRRFSQDQLIDVKPDQVSVTIISDQVKNKQYICDNDNGETKIDLSDSKTKMISEQKRAKVPCVDMLPPGRIAYITETPEFHSGHDKADYCGEPRWRIRWADRTEFSEIIVHERIIGDHLPYRMHKSLKVLAMEHRRIAPIPSHIVSKSSTTK